MLIVHRVHDDAITLRDIFISYVDSGTIFLTLCGLSAILKISDYIGYILFIKHDLANLKIDLLANFIIYYILKVSFFKDKRLYKMRHLCH
jgi:hypothetical protein